MKHAVRRFPANPRAVAGRVALWSTALALAGVAGLLPRVEAQTQDQQQQKFGETIVTADNIDYDLGKKQVVASGNVELISGESRITSEKMTVQMTPARGLDWAKCEGKVYVEKKNPQEGTGMEARGQTLDYSETNQKAVLDGDVTAHMLSPRLAKPAVITGSKVEMDLKTQQNVVFRSPAAQAKIHVEPKGEEGKKTPEPLDLTADKIEMNSVTQEYIATGKPVMQKPTSKLQARRIRFVVESNTNDVKTAYAEQDVIFDGKGENGQVIHTTANNGVYNRDNTELVLTGMVQAQIREPGDDRPTVYQGAKFIHNTVSGRSNLVGTKEEPAKVIVPGGKLGTPGEKPAAEEKKPAAEEKKAPAASGTDKK